MLGPRHVEASGSRYCRSALFRHSGRGSDLQREVPARNLLVDRHAWALGRLGRAPRMDLSRRRRVHRLVLREEPQGLGFGGGFAGVASARCLYSSVNGPSFLPPCPSTTTKYVPGSSVLSIRECRLSW